MQKLYLNNNVKNRLSRMKIIIIFTAFFLFLMLQIQAQTIKSVLNQSTNNYINNYKIDIKYKLYRGLTNNLLGEYDGKYMVNNKDIYNKIKTTEFISSNNKFIKINHSQKALIFSNKPLDMGANNIAMDFDALLKVFNLGNLVQDDSHFQCELITKKEVNLPFKKLLILVDKKTYMVKKQILFLNNKLNFSKNKSDRDIDFVRMVVEFSAIKNITKQDKEKFNISRFITISNKKPKLNIEYKDYKIINYDE